MKTYQDLLEKIDWLYEHTEGLTNEYIHEIVEVLQRMLKETR